MNDPQDREMLLDLVAAYALGVLPAGQSSLVAALILSDPEARREYDEARATANLVGLSAEEPVDSSRAARMKERLMAAVRNDAPPGRVPAGATRTSALGHDVGRRGGGRVCAGQRDPKLRLALRSA